MGEGLILSLHGAFALARMPFVWIANAFFRHGSGDYYTVRIEEDNPEYYFFTHLRSWPFRPYDRQALLHWAGTSEGKAALEQAGFPPVSGSPADE